MSPNSATNFVVSISKRLALSPAATLYYVYIILGDPGAVRRRRKLSRTGKESPWDATLTEPVPRLIWVLASDWAQKVIFDKHSNELRNWIKETPTLLVTLAANGKSVFSILATMPVF